METFRVVTLTALHMLCIKYILDPPFNNHVAQLAKNALNSSELAKHKDGHCGS